MILGPKRKLPHPPREHAPDDEFSGLENLDRPELDESPESAIDHDWADWEDVSQYRERGKRPPPRRTAAG